MKKPEQYWFDRRSGQWNDFDSNPSTSYYKFLRAVYQMGATEAYRRSRNWTYDVPYRP